MTTAPPTWIYLYPRTLIRSQRPAHRHQPGQPPLFPAESADHHAQEETLLLLGETDNLNTTHLLHRRTTHRSQLLSGEGDTMIHQASVLSPASKDLNWRDTCPRKPK